MSNEVKTANKPSHYAYSVRDRGEGKKSIWTRVGAAFAHEDTEGMTITLDALPVNGRIVLRTPRVAPAPADSAEE